MKTWRAILLLLLVWVAIYLVQLGSEELRGEEARRIVPAQEMLATGDWIVPRIAGEVYSNKPPLINWLIAASFAVTGTQSESAARLPSVLSLLALALVAFFSLRRRLGIEKAVIVPLILLTAVAMIDKCRTAEIEAVFIALFGIACLLWIKWWTEERSPWLYWTVPYFFLGLGCLAKGPVHVLFWVLFLTATLRTARQLRSLLHPAHFLGIGISLAVFLPWMFLNISRVASSEESVGTWTEQIKQRVDYGHIDWADWLSHPFEMLLNFAPWSLVLLFTLFFRRKWETPTDPVGRWNATTRGCLVATIVGCGLLCLTPGGLPRYVMPVYPLAATAAVVCFFRLPAVLQSKFARFWKIGFVVMSVGSVTGSVVLGAVAVSRGHDVAWWQIVAGTSLLVPVILRMIRADSPESVFRLSACAAAAGFIAFYSALLPFQIERDDYRPAAEEFATLLPNVTEPIVVYADSRYRNDRPQHLRLLFYLRQPFTAIGETGSVPLDAGMIVGPQDSEKAMREKATGFRIRDRHKVMIDNAPFVALLLERR